MRAILLALLAVVAAAPACAAEMSRGEYVARAADCVACHSVPGGPAFGGGLKMGSPLGAIYATNVSPDPQSGIGRYTLEDFKRAMRDGVARDGHHLYPAMPYPSYAKLSDDDIQALYTYFMNEVPPTQQATPANDIPWALSFRWPLALWNVAFGGGAPYADKPGHDAEWNRGAYLVEGPARCRRRRWTAPAAPSWPARCWTRGPRPTCAATSAPGSAVGRPTTSPPSCAPATTASAPRSAPWWMC